MCFSLDDFDPRNPTKEQLQALGVSPDGICITRSCDESLMENGKQAYRSRCPKCKKGRADYFRRKYYEDKGWDTSKL